MMWRLAAIFLLSFSMAHSMPKLSKKLLSNSEWAGAKYNFVFSMDKVKVYANALIFQGDFKIKSKRKVLLGLKSDSKEKINLLCSLKESDFIAYEYMFVCKPSKKSKKAGGVAKKAGLLGTYYSRISILKLKFAAEQKVKTLGMRHAVTTDRVYFRKGPGQKYEKISCDLDTDMWHHTGSHKLLPRGTPLLLVAQTVQKFKIKKWSKRWFLVIPNYGYHQYNDCDVQYGWIYGEFIKEEK